MNTNKGVLSSLLITTQTAQIRIRKYLNTCMAPELREALECQLREYDTIEREAQAIACQRGWDLRELDPAVRILTGFRAKIAGRKSDSTIARTIIRANTEEMIAGLENLHRISEQDKRVKTLSQKLLDFETANIRQMQPFL